MSYIVVFTLSHFQLLQLNPNKHSNEAQAPGEARRCTYDLSHHLQTVFGFEFEFGVNKLVGGSL